MSNDQLTVIGEPVFLKRRSDRTTFVDTCYGRSDNVVRKIRAWKCRDVPGLMTEFGAAFQFFDGFGENWHALEELLCYLDEWLPAHGYVVVVERAEELLADEPTELRWFVAVMKDVASWWASPVEGDGRFDRPAQPFKVVLEVSKDESFFCCRMQEANAEMIEFDLGSV